VIEVTTPEQRERFCALPGPAPLSPAILERHRPDASLLLADAGRCSLWWTDTPPHAEHCLGAIGHYWVQDADAARQLLNVAADRLAAHGCTLAVGPMDGNTWRSYRLLSERGDQPPFFLEPDNPDAWAGQFLDNGFTPLAQYYSALSGDLTVEDPRLAEVARRLADDGILFRPLNPDRFEDELRSIYQLSLASFQQNFLYTPIGVDEFIAQYSNIKPHVRPELVLIAEKQGMPVGYVFGIPDLLQAKRGQKIDTAIVKTVAVHPQHGRAGLGGLLVARCHEAARALGYQRAIHALMHETNKSRRISGHTAHVFRRYTLFARALESRP
jgi:L-amino acid N-acyltransferase YncA